MMQHLWCLLAGAALLNALPHLANGTSGRSFPTPFAKPPGKGRSSAVTNVLWGFANLILAYAAGSAGGFRMSDPVSLSTSAGGGLLLALYLAHRFGRLEH